MSTPDTLTRELAALDDALAGRAVDPDLADLAELAVALRDERPAPDPAFARTLDARVERGFPRAAGAAQAARHQVAARDAARARRGRERAARGRDRHVDPEGQRRLRLPPSGGGAGSSIATTEEAPSDTGSTPPTAAKRAPPATSPRRATPPRPRRRRLRGRAEHRDRAPAADLAANSRADRGTRRSVERSAELVLATPPREIDRAAAEILRVTDELGGYVVSSTVSSNSSGQFELRVPERRLQAALSRLSRVAKVRQRTQSAQDITGAVVSVRERLKDARTERRSLLRQLAAATTPNQTSSIRARLRLVSGQIAAAKRDLSRVQIAGDPLDDRRHPARRPQERQRRRRRRGGLDPRRRLRRRRPHPRGHRRRAPGRRSRCCSRSASSRCWCGSPRARRRSGGVSARSTLCSLARRCRRHPRTSSAGLLGRVPVFAELAEEDLARVAEVAVPRAFEPQQVIFREGDDSDTCYIVRSGHARAIRQHADGRMITLATFGPGDIFGELAMFDDERRSATLEALDALATLAIPGSAMRTLLRRHPEIAVKLVIALGRRLRAANERLSSQSFQTVQSRVASVLDQLVEQARAEGEAGESDVLVTATQAELAQLAGSSRESASRFLAVLERAGVITQGRGRLTVHDPAALRGYVY